MGKYMKLSQWLNFSTKFNRNSIVDYNDFSYNTFIPVENKKNMKRCYLERN